MKCECCYKVKLDGSGREEICDLCVRYICEKCIVDDEGGIICTDCAEECDDKGRVG